MKTRKKLKSIAVFSFLTLALLALSSCSKGTSIYSSNPIENDYKNYSAEETSITYYDIEKSAHSPVLPSSGTSKILVIPIAVKGFENVATEETRSKLNDAFNKEVDDPSAIQSVSSFYKSSSFGKKTLDFTISDWYQSGLDRYEIVSHKANDDDGGSWYLMDQATDWYKRTTGNDLTEFDEDKDGFVDALWLIYGCPHYTEENGFPHSYWAYKYYNINNANKSNVSSPVGFLYAWASYDFMFNEYGEKEIDANTYIHETGHLHGLVDYYDYSSQTAPFGGIDMMDNGFNDHNSFSKFSLGWVKPYVAKGSCTLSLRDYSKYGDCLILSPNYNGMAFGEYIMIELYSPNGLLKLGSTKSPYTKSYRGYRDYGVRITHVNSTLYVVNDDFSVYTPIEGFDPNKSIAVLANNSKNDDPKRYPLLSVLTPNGKSKGLDQQCTYNISALYIAHDTFSIDKQSKAFPTGKLSLGKEFPYTVEFGTTNSDFTNVKVTYTA